MARPDNSSLGRVIKAVRQLNPSAPAGDAEKSFTFALIGTPEEIAGVAHSHTGQYLRRELSTNQRTGKIVTTGVSNDGEEKSKATRKTTAASRKSGTRTPRQKSR